MSFAKAAPKFSCSIYESGFNCGKNAATVKMNIIAAIEIRIRYGFLFPLKDLNIQTLSRFYTLFSALYSLSTFARSVGISSCCGHFVLHNPHLMHLSALVDSFNAS